MKETISKLKKKADTVYSQWLRKKYANKRGYVRCYTCCTLKLIKEMQCGHYYSRSINFLRYDPRNTKPQCQGCNIWKEGNKPEYALALTKEYGEGILEELHKDSLKYKQWTVGDLKEIITLFCVI